MLSVISSQESDGNTEIGRPTWAQQSGGVERWREVDSALRGIARRRAALDADDLLNPSWLREAQALKIWRPLGMTNAQDYMERILGYGPKAAQDRMRVAEALGNLPVMESALAQGELSFSAVRELSRVATPETETAWTDAARGMNLRQIETLVTGRRSGDLPDDPPDPDVRTHVVRFELSAEVFAVMRQARAILDADHRTNLTDDDFITVLANMVLEGATDFPTSSVESEDVEEDRLAAAPTATCGTGNTRDGAVEALRDDESGPGVGTDAHHRARPTTGAKYTIAVTVCARCNQGWQLGAGAMLAIGPAALARAECDARHIGSLDAAMPQRAHQDISPAVARFVWHRDQGRCQTPGCRSSRGLEIHHIVPRSEGGGHAPDNLRIHCSACHKAQHDGRLAITDKGERIDVRSWELATPRLTPLATTTARAQAKDALVRLGWKPAISRAAIDAVLSERGELPIEDLIWEALRRCPKV